MRVAVLIAAVIAAVGCGAGSSATPPGTGGSSATSLSITYWAEGRAEGNPIKWTLRCNPAAGTLPKRGTACTKLSALKNPFAPPAKGVECTQQYGGPQQAQVTGTFRGKRVWIALAARDGCEISRAKRLAFLVPGWGSSAAA
jgi:hypothetical protein